ncbi:stage III sporulation protein AF [Cohnella terricola]|nr:stage III sporulation protein AF [Cohnella terricola]
MDALSGWLRQVIAVILLASLIDLILPNRTMQRYVRLVAGLFILMTVATPIMHWLKGDFGGKLAAGLQSVERSPGDAERELAMIEEEGAKLRDSHLAQAEKLVAARLESEIRGEVEQEGRRSVRKVDVKLARERDGALKVAQVVVELELADPEAGTGGGTQKVPVRDIEAIADVDIEIRAGSIGSADRDLPVSGRESGDRAAAAREDRVDRETRTRIAALVASRFGIAADIVVVKLPATAAERN